MMLSFSVTTIALAQDAANSEEYIAKHDGGDRAEYLQELENSEPLFYVPPVNRQTRNTIPLSFCATKQGVQVLTISSIKNKQEAQERIKKAEILKNQY